MRPWRNQIDNVHFVEPSVIHGLGNGSDALKAILHPIYDHEGYQVGLAAPTAAQSYNAMVLAAWRDGVVLKPTSSADTFRPLKIQQQIFADRYRETDQGNGSRVCNGKRWWLRKGKATAACPGTSNHGKGCAVDFDLQFPAALAWLEDNAKRFGWQWEVSSEDWHLHYMLGDQLPAGIDTTDHETGPGPEEEDDMCLYEVTAGPDQKKVFLVAGNVRRQQDKTSAERLIKAGIPYRKVDDIAWEQIGFVTAAAHG